MNHPNILHNVAALTVIYGANYLLPLITLPYLTRVLGVEAWGQLAFTQIVLGFFTLMTNWGLMLSATRRVAAIRDDPIKLSETFFSIWLAQWCLALVGSAILIILVAALPIFRQHAIFYLLGAAQLVSAALLPLWLLNGLERMKPAATFQIVARVAVVPCIFLMIHSPQQAPLVIAINAAATAVAGTMLLIWIHKEVSLQWKRPTLRVIYKQMKEALALSTSSISVGMYATLVPMVLGMLEGPAALGYYAFADRVKQAAESALSPISQALFPRMSNLYANNTVAARKLLIQGGLCIALAAGAISCVLWFWTEPIVVLLAGESFAPASIVLKWFAPLPLILAFTNLFGMQVMLPNHRNTAYVVIFTISGILGIGALYPVIQWDGLRGAAINTFFIECFIVLLMLVYLVRQGFFSADSNWSGSR